MQWPQRRAAPKRLHDDLVGLTGGVTGSSAARAETPNAALDGGNEEVAAATAAAAAAERAERAKLINLDEVCA